MTRPALQHTFPMWEPPEDDPSAPEEEWREVQRGRMRIVRNHKRAAKLRRRGVPLWRHERCWLWFVEPPEREPDAFALDAMQEDW